MLRTDEPLLLSAAFELVDDLELFATNVAVGFGL